MPKPRVGKIPPTRLAVARRVRDYLNLNLKGRGWGYAIVSIQGGGYSVLVRLFEGVELDKPIPRLLDGIPVRVGRIPYPRTTHGQD